MTKVEKLEKEHRERYKEMMCDNFCKFPELYSAAHGEDAEYLMHDEVCKVCPLKEL